MSNGLCIAEKYGQKDSPENMSGIRSIMVQQETLFKEQVNKMYIHLLRVKQFHALIHNLIRPYVAGSSSSQAI